MDTLKICSPLSFEEMIKTLKAILDEQNIYGSSVYSFAEDLYDYITENA